MSQEELSPILEGALLQGLRDFGDKYDLSSQPDLYQCLQDCLRKALLNIKMDELIAEGAANGGKKKSRNTSGYNEYIKEAWAEYRAQKKLDIIKDNSNDLAQTLPQETMSDFAKKWKSMKDIDKKKYMDIATQKNMATKAAAKSGSGTAAAATTAAGTAKVTRRKGPLSGYQYYITLEETKSRVPPGLTSMEQMSYKAKMWGGLTDQEKLEFKNRSETEFWTNNPDLYEQYQQELAEKALKTVTQNKMVEATKMPVVTLPVLRKPIAHVDATSATTAATSATSIVDQPKLRPLLKIRTP